MVYKRGKPGPASKKAAKEKSYPLSRSDEIFGEVVSCFVNSQINEKDQLTDVHLVCKDGVIPVHAIILKAASNFLAEALESQGDSYTTERLILLPDYYIKDMRHVVQIIYSGICQFADNETAKDIADILEDLGVENTKASKGKDKSSNDVNAKEVRCYLTKRINRPCTGAAKNLSELKALFGSQADGENKDDSGRPGSSKGRLRKRRKNTSSDDDKSSDSDDNSEPDKRKTRLSTKSIILGSPRVVMERSLINVANVAVASSKQQTTSVHTGTSNVAVRKVNVYNYNGNQNQNNDDEENDPDSDGWEEPDYNNKTWFETEARKCQKCNKQHPSPAAASTCITSHTRLRCYFCFTIAKNTEKLFEHFEKRHKKAGRENCLMCPYCESTVPFKSVSCHVISIHLSENRGQIKAKVGPGRPPSVVTPTTPVNQAAVASSSSSSKSGTPISGRKENLTQGGLLISNESDMASDDDGLLRVGNLDVTIRNKIGNGKIMVYHLQKDRSST